MCRTEPAAHPPLPRPAPHRHVEFLKPSACGVGGGAVRGQGHGLNAVLAGAGPVAGALARMGIASATAVYASIQSFQRSYSSLFVVECYDGLRDG